MQTATQADLNRDGVLDVVWVSGIDSSINVRLGNADGTYQPPQSFAAGPSPGSIAVGDFNGDDWADVVVGGNLTSGSPTQSVLLNDGNW